MRAELLHTPTASARSIRTDGGPLDASLRIVTKGPSEAAGGLPPTSFACTGKASMHIDSSLVQGNDVRQWPLSWVAGFVVAAVAAAAAPLILVGRVERLPIEPRSQMSWGSQGSVRAMED